MRVTGTGHGGEPFWVELRDPDQLSGADEDAWKRVYENAIGNIDVELTEDDMEVSEDGTSMVPKKRTVQFHMSMVSEQRDALLSRLITDWSFTDVPLPYTSLSRERLPLAACKALDAAITEHKRLLNASGPDPKGVTTSTSASGSKDAPAARRKA